MTITIIDNSTGKSALIIASGRGRPRKYFMPLKAMNAGDTMIVTAPPAQVSAYASKVPGLFTTKRLSDIQRGLAQVKVTRVA